MLRERILRLLQTYTLEEILEFNDMELEDILEVLYVTGSLVFPPEPVS